MERLTNIQGLLIKCMDCEENDNCYDANCSQIDDALKLLKMYEEIGLTPEQVKQLKERDTAKRPLKQKDTYTPKLGEFRIGKCPNCGAEVVDKFNVCFECRQKIEWSE